MKRIWLIRHGESVANAGAATDNHVTIPLSETGHKQAQEISQIITCKPDIIITSPFLRTQETASYTIKRYPDAPVAVWDVQEFTYLAPTSCIGTTAADRRERVNTYWQRLDPDYIDGQDAESFSMLLSRARMAIERLMRLEEKYIIMFTHAQFIRAMMLLKDNQEQDEQYLMSRFRELPKYGNCEVVVW
ncbi:histidine phosphatase family protein [Sporomusa sp. GT1]|uniref:histidine phosphatase family protein n=1 Tax=Sporomusa sp. GT1 TaxID=1534747 RepID=UPI00166A8586|nr:phosphoglycerate mutase family protein [Sporomusa sp. GT1]